MQSLTRSEFDPGAVPTEQKVEEKKEKSLDYWYGDQEHRNVMNVLRPRISISVLLNHIASFLHLRYQLILPASSGHMRRVIEEDDGEEEKDEEEDKKDDTDTDDDDTDTDEDEEEEEEEQKPYSFACPLVPHHQHYYNVCGVEHPDEGEGQSGVYANYRVHEKKWITQFRMTKIPSPGSYRSWATYNGILWHHGYPKTASQTTQRKGSDLETESVYFDNEHQMDNGDYTPEKGYRVQYGIRFVHPHRRDLDNVENVVNRLKHKTGLVQVIGATIYGQFICAFREEVSVDTPQSSLSRLLGKLLDIEEDTFSKDLADTPFLLLDTR